MTSALVQGIASPGRRCLATTSLFNGNRFGQISWLVYVATAAHGDVVSEQLQRHNFDHRREQFHGGRNVDDVLHQAADGGVALGGYGDYAAGARRYFLD